MNQRIPKDSYKNCLFNAAQQFIVRRNKSTEIKAGFPLVWYLGKGYFYGLARPSL